MDIGSNKLLLLEPITHNHKANTTLVIKEISPELKRLPEEKKIKKQKRCGYCKCKKKLSLTALQCKCGKKFCMKHFNAEKHNCSFDFDARAKQYLNDKVRLEGTVSDKIRDRI